MARSNLRLHVPFPFGGESCRVEAFCQATRVDEVAGKSGSVRETLIGLCMQVYREVPSGSRNFEVVGETEMTASSVGTDAIYLADADHIEVRSPGSALVTRTDRPTRILLQVQANDFLGWADWGQGVIGFEDGQMSTDRTTVRDMTTVLFFSTCDSLFQTVPLSDHQWAKGHGTGRPHVLDSGHL